MESAIESFGFDDPTQEISVKDFEALIEIAYKKKAEVKALEEVAEAEKIVLKEHEAKIMAFMEQLGKSSYKSNHGTVVVSEKCSVTTPKDPESKKALFAWLEEKGIFDDYVSVNSQKLNSLFNAEVESTNNPSFRLPGVEAPKYYKTLSLRSK